MSNQRNIFIAILIYFLYSFLDFSFSLYFLFDFGFLFVFAFNETQGTANVTRYINFYKKNKNKSLKTRDVNCKEIKQQN